MQEIINMVVDNGIGVACVIYMIYFQNTTMKEILNTLQIMNTRLTKIETKVGIDGEN